MQRWFSGLIVLALTLQACGLFDSGIDDGYSDEVSPAIVEDLSPFEPEPLTRTGATTVEDKWDLWTAGTRLRGADLHPCKLIDEETCLEPITLRDVYELAASGANLINASYPGVFAVNPPHALDPVAVAYLDNLIAWAEEIGIYVVIHFRTGPGRNEAAIHRLRGADMSIWTDPTAQEGWLAMWQYVADRYGNSPVVIGYNLLVEPLANLTVDPDQELEPEQVQAQLEGTPADWNMLAKRITAAIREVDSDTPILVDSMNWASAQWFSVLEPTGDPRTIYSFHTYDPDVYTNQEQGQQEIHYPDEVEDYGETIIFDIAWLDENLQPVVDFAERHDVPIYVGEFGAMRWVPGAADFIRDQTSLFEKYGWNYAYYVWRGDEVYFDGFNMEYGPDPSRHSPEAGNEVMELYLERWEQNVYFPATGPEPSGQSQELSNADPWLYLIDVNLDQAVVDQIAASSYAMVVLDNIPSEASNTDYPMESVIDQLHTAKIPKIVLAYVDIGEAEDYRTYWQPGWGVGTPEWIAGSDPDGWEGNFPVAYWYDAWQALWLGEGGLMEGILDVGFDGIYLDWIEAYSDESVIDIAEQDQVDPVQEMIWWVENLASYGRARRPDFLVIGQNAAELARFDEYVAIIDAIAQEQVWFDGGADNDPPGDCPLPRTEDEIETEKYRSTLSPACRRQHDEFPESTLHVSSESYIEDLLVAQAKGLEIFTIDYALDPENIAWVYETSRSLGFHPFVSNRNLDQFIPPQP
jgi:cysteinyl-tRNA synthetase